MEWIKVEDILPEKGKYVLVTFKSGFDNKPSYGLEIAEYYGIAVNKSYPVGRIIRDYWMAKAREEYW